MNEFFRRLSLPVKLLLLILFPLALVIFLTSQVYIERSSKMTLLSGYLERINVSSEISELLNSLQLERRYSYAYALTENIDAHASLETQRPYTDLAIKKLQLRKDSTIKDFTKYTFLNQLADIRKMVDDKPSAETVMQYYTTAIFRINTLNLITPVYSNVYLKPVYSDLVGQKLLSEMATYLGIIRANIFTALYTQKNMQGILFGTAGVNDIYKSYEAELFVKASPATLEKYKQIRSNSELKPTIDYMERCFKTFSFDSLYNAEQWWETSGKATDQLRELQKALLKDVTAKVSLSYKQEERGKEFTLVLLIVAIVLLAAIMLYTTHVITKMLRELNVASQKIASGALGVDVQVVSNDVIGGLAGSIAKIDEANRQLAAAADAIGKGNFEMPLIARSKDDVLGTAILKMRNNLQRFTHELEKSKRQFKQVADTAPVMIWMTDEDKQCNFVNKEWLRFSGRRAEQEMGYGWIEGMHPEDYSHCAEVFDVAFNNRRQYHVEYRFRSSEGEYKWLSEIGVPRYSIEEKFEGYIGTCIDIHDIKIHEQRRDDFIKMASHELKTPVTSVKGYVQLLLDMFQKDYKNIPPEVIQKALSTIDKQITKLTRLMGELLDLSRIDSGKLELDVREFNLNDIVSETVQDLRYSNNHNIIIKADAEYNVRGDKDRIAQVLSNLLTNAVKYSPDSKNIEVSIQHADDGNVAVNVKDHGIGIDKKDHQKIFERFYRAEGWSEQTYPGFGIGLFIASEIIQRHKGTISVESEKGKGSCFTFTLPVHQIIKSRTEPAIKIASNN
jgi:PAS domain S-box-containing protein